MNACAVAGFVSAIASLLVPFFGLTSTIALSLSAIGFHIARMEKGRKGIALAGLIISIVSVVLACAENMVLLLHSLGKLSL